MATIDIELYYDLDRRRWTTSAGGLATQPSLFIGQSNTIDFKVRFVQGGVPIELTSPSWIAGIKVTDDPLGDYLLLTTTGTQTGTGATTIYTFTLNIDSVELQAYLVGITPSTNSTAFEVRDTVNNIATLPAITCSILPDYTLTGATPAAASGTLVVDSGATFTVHKTFAMPTDDGQNNYVLKTNGSGVGSWVADNAGTGTVTSVAQSFTGGIIQVSGSPITTSGTLALTIAGSQGGIVYFTTNSGWGSTGPLGAGGLIVGGGTSIPTVLAAVASGRVLTSAGTLTTPAYSSTITLGASGTLGTITLGNATSGTILITPPTGALGTLTITLPSTSTTLAGLAVTQAFTQVNTFSNATASTSSSTGALLVTGGIGVALVTDATSSTNGGAVTIAGGLAVAKKLFVGTSIDIVATTSTAGQITQAGARLLHTFGGTGNIWLGLTTGNTAVALTGTNNIGLGTNAGKSMTNGANNLLIGSNSGEFITTGFNNCCVGASSGYNIGTGTYNTAIGYVALQFGGSGGYNTAIGQASLQNITSGTLNVAIGSDAGDDTSTVGELTGANITSGASNTLIGALAASTSATGSFRTAIGSGSRCESNNAIKLGRDTLDVVLLPKMTQAEMATAATTLGIVKGAIVYCLDGGAGTADHVHFYNGTSWAKIN